MFCNNDLFIATLNAKNIAEEFNVIGKPVTIKRVIFNAPATIVFWSDGDKTVVKAVNEPFDPEKGLAMAITKKLLGNNKGSYFNELKKWLPPKEVVENDAD